MASLCSRVRFGHFSQEPGEKMLEFLQRFSTGWLHTVSTMGGTDAAIPMCAWSVIHSDHDPWSYRWKNAPRVSVSFPRQPDLICTKAVGDREGFCAEGAAIEGWGQLAWAAGGGLARGSGTASCPSLCFCKRGQHNQRFIYTGPVFVLGCAIWLHFNHLLHESLISPLNPHWKSCVSHSFLF